jgi:hypothetical protein
MERLGAVARNQNYIHEEVKSRLNSKHACYRTVLQILLRRPNQEGWDGWMGNIARMGEIR